MGFVDFGDAESYRTELVVLRAKLAALKFRSVHDGGPPGAPPPA
jgi:hypothetical protein